MAALSTPVIQRYVETLPAEEWEVELALDTAVDPTKTLIFVEPASTINNALVHLVQADLDASGEVIYLRRGTDSILPTADTIVSVTVVEFDAGLTVTKVNTSSLNSNVAIGRSIDPARTFAMLTSRTNSTFSPRGDGRGVYSVRLEDTDYVRVESHGSNLAEATVYVVELDADAGARVQYCEGTTTGSGNLVVDATIDEVDLTRTSIIMSNRSSENFARANQYCMMASLLDSTTVRMQRGQASSNSATACCFVIEWPDGVHVQTDEVEINGSTLLYADVGDMTSEASVGYIGFPWGGRSGSPSITAPTANDVTTYLSRVLDNGWKLRISRAATVSNRTGPLRWWILTFGEGSPPENLTEAISSVGTGQWIQFGPLLSTKVEPHRPTNVPGTLVNTAVTAGITAWCGAALTPNHFIFHGGGHGDGANNGMYGYSRSTGLLEVLHPEVPYTENIDAYQFVPLEAPSAQHTYDGIVYVEGADSIFIFANSRFDPVGAVSERGIWQYDVSGNTWGGYREYTGRPPANVYASCDIGGGLVFLFSSANYAYVYDVVNDVIVDTDSYLLPSDAGVDDKLSADWDSVNQCVWVTVNGTGTGLWQIPIADNEIGTPVLANSEAGGRHGVACRNGKVYLWDGGREVLVYDPATDTETSVEPGIGPVQQSVIWSKWAYLDEWDVFVGLANRDQGPWYFKPTDYVPRLMIDDGWHGHVADQAAFAQVHSLALSDAVHAHAADMAVLSVHHILAVDDAAHAQTTDTAGIAQVHVLEVAGATHAQTADEAGFVTVGELAVDDTHHGQVAEPVEFAQVHTLSIADALSGLTSDTATITVAGSVRPDSTLHGLTSDVTVLAQVHSLASDSGTMAHTADNATVVPGGSVVLHIASCRHAHLADNAPISQSHHLAIADGLNDHYADEVVILLPHVLAINSALHAHMADNATIIEGTPPRPNDRTIKVYGQRRTIIVN